MTSTNREHQHREWKESWRDEFLKWICGFANAEGGVLDIGRDDTGRVVGLPDAERLLEELPNKVRDVLGIVVAVNLLEEDGRPYLRIVTDPYPISYKGQYHVRSGSTKQELKGAALDRFLLRKQGRTWDSVPAPGFTQADLAPAALETFRQLAERAGRVDPALLEATDDDLLDKLHLRDGAHLKRAAVLLFGRDPERLITGAYSKIGYFRSDSDLVFHDVVRGNVFAQVERVIDLLTTKYLKATIRYEGVQRRERLPVPEAALREAVINAIAHKDYAAAIPIQISVYPDRLMLWNPGHLPEGWTIDHLLAKHASHPFNPDLANAFFRTALLESWGRGIDLIRKTCRDADSPEPTLRWDNGLWLEFAFPAWAVAQETPVETPVETQQRTPERILAILRRESHLPLRAVADHLGLDPRTVERAITKLVEAGKLRHVGPRKGGHWEVRP